MSFRGTALSVEQCQAIPAPAMVCDKRMLGQLPMFFELRFAS